MNTTAVHWLGRSTIIAATAALLAACAGDASLAPERRAAAGASRTAELGQCDSIQVPAGHKLATHTYAEGVQIYRWSGAEWVFAGPEANLYSDAAGTDLVGTHFGGPTWRSNSGSEVKAAVAKRCPVGPNAIPWLLLGATSQDGPGIFDRITYIHRVNTVGGTAPVGPGSFVGQEKREPYTAEYFFYRAQ